MEDKVKYYFAYDAVDRFINEIPPRAAHSRLAERAAAPRAGCLKGSIFLSARVCIIYLRRGLDPH